MQNTVFCIFFQYFLHVSSPGSRVAGKMQIIFKKMQNTLCFAYFKQGCRAPTGLGQGSPKICKTQCVLHIFGIFPALGPVSASTGAPESSARNEKKKTTMQTYAGNSAKIRKLKTTCTKIHYKNQHAKHMQNLYQISILRFLGCSLLIIS